MLLKMRLLLEFQRLWPAVFLLMMARKSSLAMRNIAKNKTGKKLGWQERITGSDSNSFTL
jgi:hypothetical protein